MKIVQITDIHIGQPNEMPQGIDVREQFTRVLAHVKLEKATAVVISGDLCYQNGIESTYKWIKKTTESYLNGIPFYCIAGNHDDSRLCAKIFGQVDNLSSDEWYYMRDWKGKSHFKAYFLDTAKGYCSNSQKQWLADQLLLDKNLREICIFMHHPPCLSGVPHMDNNYALSDREDFIKLFSTHPEKKFRIFCGHYHNDRVITDANWQVFISPSSFLQIAHNHVSFEVLHTRPGYRVMDWQINGSLRSWTNYV